MENGTMERGAIFRNPVRNTISLGSRFCMIVTTLVAISVSTLITANGSGLSNAITDETAAARCSARVRQFVKEIDVLLDEDPDSVVFFYDPIQKYLPAKGCDVDEIIRIARQSKFFWTAYDWDSGYTIGFRSVHFEITFGLRKNTGDIEYPAAQIRMPTM
jgi:hypothetical protein